MSLLALDVGNTSTMVGLFDAADLVARWRVETRRAATSDEYAFLITGLMRMVDRPASDVQACVLSCVVPPLLPRLEEMVQTAFGCEAFTIRPAELGIPIEYHPPTAVGSDRVANAVAAAELYSLPAVIVDFGTTTTVDVVSESGAYLGGAIAPGIEASVAALYANTARLPRVDIRPPAAAIGRSTEESIRSGVVFGFAAQVDGLVRRCAAELAARPVVIATGGQARLIGTVSETIQHIDETLTLHGMRLLYDRHSPPTG